MQQALVAVPAKGLGLYRIRGADGTLLYIGEGSIRSRLKMHGAKAQRAILPQEVVFANAQPPDASWVVSSMWAAHQREELETDLIAGFTLATRTPPAAQFIG